MSYGEVVTDSGTRPMTEAEMRVRIQDLRQELGALMRLLYGPYVAPYWPWPETEDKR